MSNLVILLDNGHGENTAGKRSPQFPHGGRLSEYMYNRVLAGAIKTAAEARGLRVVMLCPELEDAPLKTRAKRANDYIRKHPDDLCVLLSIHGNAAGDGTKWMQARGWEAWTTTAKNNSDYLARCLYDAMAKALPDMQLRGAKTGGKEKNFTLLYLANCPAVLTENLFYDNLEDAALMMQADTRRALAEAHVGGVMKYFAR